VAVYVADNTLTLPPDDQPIWRYVTFTKMVALLLHRVLRFARADTVLDRFEIGIPTRDMATTRQWTADGIADGTISRDGLMSYLAAMSEQPRASFERMAVDQLVTQTMRYTSRALFVSSWHLNAGESAAMWDLYLGAEPGVAIQSTVGALREQMDAGSGATEVFIGAVEYIDYATDSWGSFRAFNRVFHKRSSFEHERELRAVIVRPRYAELADLDVDKVVDAARNGIDVPIAVDRLVQRLWVSPRADQWFASLVERVVGQFDIDVPIVRSRLYDAPEY
jgi:hypothetical protein